MKKKKPVIVEYRYVGNDLIWSQFFSATWKRWGSYWNEKSAEMSMKSRKRKYKDFEFRIKT